MSRIIRHLYIHVPFCSGVCVYCGFYSERHTTSATTRWLEALALEIAQIAAAGWRLVPETVYCGGGTPSTLSRAHWLRLGAILAPLLRRPPREWTVEANPGGLDRPTLDTLRAMGVNRLSFGAQSFDEAVLAAMGRRHAVADIGASIALARAAGFRRIGLDLIAGWPGVTPAAWRAALDAALDLRPEHLSVYGLSIEPDTPLADAVARGHLQAPDDDTLLALAALTERRLARQGFTRYEYSNFARSGHICRHNLAVWQGEDYIGLGPAAASRAGAHRWTNAPDMAAWADALERGTAPPRESERLPPATDLDERLAFAFRLRRGVALAAFARARGPAARARLPVWRARLERLRDWGLVRRQGAHWMATRGGRDLADTIAGELLVGDP